MRQCFLYLKVKYDKKPAVNPAQDRTVQITTNCRWKEEVGQDGSGCAKQKNTNTCGIQPASRAEGVVIFSESDSSARRNRSRDGILGAVRGLLVLAAGFGSPIRQGSVHESVQVALPIDGT